MDVQTVLPSAVEESLDLGLIDTEVDVIDQFKEIVGRSAILTNPKGNRRFGDFALYIRDKHVISVSLLTKKLTCEECKGTKIELVSEVCELCDGDGCDACSDEGVIPRTIPCQHCPT